MAKELTLPTIHLNGTDPDRLYEDLDTASRALWKAHDALLVCSPHIRDYYPQGDSAFARANAAHVERIWQIREIVKDLGTLMEHVVNEAEKRKRR